MADSRIKCSPGTINGEGTMVLSVDGNVLLVDDEFSRITGLFRESIQGRSIDVLTRLEILPPMPINKVAETCEPITVVLRFNHAKKNAAATISPVFRADGEVTKVLVNLQEKCQCLKPGLRSSRGETSARQDGPIVAESRAMKEVLETARRCANARCTVLLTGESGAGKEVVARYIYRVSCGRNKPFVKVNCGGLPRDLVESELFGYEAGAFTGARAAGKPGLVEIARDGVLFLDEVAEIPLDLQSKILEFLDDYHFMRIGAFEKKRAQCRVIAATNRDLVEEVKKGRFRQDLFYRLNGIPINVPPLRERLEDIPALVEHYLKLFNDTYGTEKQISPEVVDLLLKYRWPGNVRELCSLLEQLVVTCREPIITKEMLPVTITGHIKLSSEKAILSITEMVPLKKAIEAVERALVREAFKLHGNTVEMAKTLGISQATAYRKYLRYVLRNE